MEEIPRYTKEELLWAYHNYEKFGNALVKGLESGCEYVAELTQEEKEELIEKLDMEEFKNKLRESRTSLNKKQIKEIIKLYRKTRLRLFLGIKSPRNITIKDCNDKIKELKNKLKEVKNENK